MTGVSGYFMDTSVFVAGIIELYGPKHPAQRLMAAVADGEFERPSTAWHCCLEFYSIATRLPREFRITPEVAAEIVEHEIMERFIVHTLPRDRRLPFIRGAGHDQIAGRRTHDAHIAEIARVAGADVVVTENRAHFVQLLRHGVRVLTASEAIEEL